MSKRLSDVDICKIKDVLRWNPNLSGRGCFHEYDHCTRYLEDVQRLLDEREEVLAHEAHLIRELKRGKAQGVEISEEQMNIEIVPLEPIAYRPRAFPNVEISRFHDREGWMVQKDGKFLRGEKGGLLAFTTLGAAAKAALDAVEEK